MSRSWVASAVGFLALGLALGPGEARAVEAAARSFQDYRALVVSGGSSLGVYEAGLLHAFAYVRAVAQEVRPPSRQELESRPVVVGGTSAGALNAFLTALALCQRPTPDPERSWFTLWLRLDWNDLLPEGGDGEPPVRFEGAATRRRVRQLMEEVEARWVDSEDWVDCNVQLGAAVTYLVPRPQPIPRSSIQLARATERFLVSLQGTKGRRPAIHVLRQLPGSVRTYPVLGPAGDGGSERSIGQLFPLLMASSGIPIIFDPISLEVIYPDGTIDAPAFIDGGTFDNVPLSTVVRLLEAARRPGEPLGQIIYIDADNVTWEAPAVRPPSRGGIEGYLSLLQGQVAGARQAELIRTLDGADGVSDALRLPRRHHLITGQMLGAFGAFFDQSFRRFDFAAGIADAEVSLEELGPSLGTLRAAGRLAALDRAIPELPCFRVAWEGTRQGEAAAGEIDRALASPECAALRDAPGEDDEARILRDEWRLLRVLLTLSPSERRISHRFYSALARVEGPPGRERGYEWVTLRGSGGLAGPGGGEQAIREQLQRLVGAVARNNAGGNVLYRMILASAGTELADAALLRRRPPWMVSFGLYDGGVELEVGRTLGWFQVVGNAQYVGGALSEHRGRSGFGDARLAGGLRTDVQVLRGVQLRPGFYLGGQGLIIYDHPPVYRPAVTGRLDVDLVKRVYIAAGMTHFLRHARGWPEWDPAIGAGLRLWW